MKESKISYHKQWYINNREKKIAYAKKYRRDHYKKIKAYEKQYKEDNRERNRERVRCWRFKKKYGISTEERNNLLKFQNYNCALCGNPLPKNKKSIHIHIDHCHKSGKIRGIVHASCNHLLGFSEENIDILNKAIQYIKKHNS